MIFLLSGRPSWLRGRQHRRLQHAENGRFPTSWEEDDVFRRHAFFDGFIHHRTEIVETLSTLCSPLRSNAVASVPLCRLCLFRQGPAPAWRPLVILNMQHGTRTRELRQQAHPGVQNSVGTTPIMRSGFQRRAPSTGKNCWRQNCRDATGV